MGFVGRVGLLVAVKLLLPGVVWDVLRGAAVVGSVIPWSFPLKGFVASFAPELLCFQGYRTATTLMFPGHARSFDFWTRVIPIYVGYKTTQISAPLLKESKQEEVWARRHEWGAEAVYRLCVEMRGFYLKDGQFIGSRADFIPEQWCTKLNKLQDQVPPVPFGSIMKVLKAELGIRNAMEVFEDITKVPLASATIAQVHRAKIRGKQGDVVVKIQYEDQESLMKLDLTNLRNLATFLQKNDMKFFDMVSIVKEFEAQIPLEFDFVEETVLMEEIRTNLTEMGICPRKVVIPKVETDLVTRRLLVMDFVDGVRVDDAKTLTAWGVDRTALFHALGEAYGRMILVDGVFHADPHPGNLLVMEDGRVALIDFGQCKRLDDDLRRQMCSLYAAIGTKNYTEIARAFTALGIVLDLSCEHDTARDDYLMAIFANGLFDTGPMPDGVEINPFADSSPLQKYPVSTFPDQLFMVLRTMGLLRGLGVTLGVPTMLSEVFQPFAYEGLETNNSNA